MQCVKCGFENPGDARFCGKCGAAMAAAPVNGGGGGGGGGTGPWQGGQGGGYGPAPAVVHPGLFWGVIAGSLIIPLVGLGMGGFYLATKKHPEEQRAAKIWLGVGVGAFLMWVAMSASQ